MTTSNHRLRALLWQGLVFDGRYRLGSLVDCVDSRSLWSSLDLHRQHACVVQLWLDHPKPQATELAAALLRQDLLKHPAFIPMTSCGHTPSGEPFTVHPPFQAKSFANGLTKLTLELSEVVGLSYTLSEAISELHQSGVVHGHLDAGSVLITIRDEAFFPLILDAGRSAEAALSHSDAVRRDLSQLGRLFRILLSHATFRTSDQVFAREFEDIIARVQPENPQSFPNAKQLLTALDALRVQLPQPPRRELSTIPNIPRLEVTETLEAEAMPELPPQELSGLLQVTHVAALTKARIQPQAVEIPPAPVVVPQLIKEAPKRSFVPPLIVGFLAVLGTGIGFVVSRNTDQTIVVETPPSAVAEPSNVTAAPRHEPTPNALVAAAPAKPEPPVSAKAQPELAAPSAHSKTDAPQPEPSQPAPSSEAVPVVAAHQKAAEPAKVDPIYEDVAPANLDTVEPEADEDLPDEAFDTLEREAMAQAKAAAERYRQNPQLFVNQDDLHVRVTVKTPEEVDAQIAAIELALENARKDQRARGLLNGVKQRVLRDLRRKGEIELQPYTLYQVTFHMLEERSPARIIERTLLNVYLQGGL